MPTRPELPEPKVHIKCCRHNAVVYPDDTRFRHRSNDIVCNSSTFEFAEITTYERADVLVALTKWRAADGSDGRGLE